MRVLCQPRFPLFQHLQRLKRSLSQEISPVFSRALALSNSPVKSLAVFQAAPLAVIFTLSALIQPALAAELNKREGWVIFESEKTYATLLQDLRAAVKVEGLAVVTQAGPTGAAAARGITIPGNQVIGVFNNDYAVRILALSTAAMIEAPVRFYVTEVGTDHSHLAYKRPSFVFTPYLNEGGGQLLRIAAELDRRFAAIAKAALR